MAYISTSEDGRVLVVVTDPEYASGMQEAQLPEDFDMGHPGDYILQGGEVVFDGAQSAAEQAAEQEVESVMGRNASMVSESMAFFLDGGKAAMEKDIEEAKSSGGTDPQIQAVARMQVACMDLGGETSTDVAAFRDYWPEWRPDTEYKYQQPLQWKGLYYRASKALTSSKVYPPDTAGESEYYPIEVAPDGVIVYRECHGQYDMVQAGETRHYPDAEGPVYRAKVDTAYDPDTVPGNWESVQ